MGLRGGRLRVVASFLHANDLAIRYKCHGCVIQIHTYQNCKECGTQPCRMTMLMGLKIEWKKGRGVKGPRKLILLAFAHPPQSSNGSLRVVLTNSQNTVPYFGLEK